MTTTQREIYEHDPARDGGPYRLFVATIGPEEYETHGGFGLTVEPVIAELQRQYAGTLETNEEERRDGRRRRHETPADWAAEISHVTIWDQDRVVAALIPDPTGAPRYDVHRLDRPPAPPTGEPAADPLASACEGLLAAMRRLTEARAEYERHNTREAGFAVDRCEDGLKGAQEDLRGLLGRRKLSGVSYRGKLLIDQAADETSDSFGDCTDVTVVAFDKSSILDLDAGPDA
jgi:hypothetical protein